MSNPSQQTPEQVVEEIRQKIQKERNIIQGFNNVKKNTSNPEVIQKCKSKIIESQSMIDYYEQTMNKLTRQIQRLNTNGTQDTANVDGRNSVVSEYKPNFSNFDLIKYECPSLGNKIQYMLQYLEFKLQVEDKYSKANEKLSRLYLMDGDKSSSNAAEGGKAESDQRIHLLEKALKKYQKFSINDHEFDRDYEIMDGTKHARKLLTGRLTVSVTCIRDVDHIATAPMKKRETIVMVKIDDLEKARTKPSKNDNWNEEMVIDVDRSHEIELSVMDKQNGVYVPVAVNWLSLFDLAEEIRKKKVAKDQGSSGWLPAANFPQNGGSSGNLATIGGSYGATSPLPPADDLTPARSPNLEPKESNVLVSTWLSLEPGGQMLVNLNFEKSLTQGKQFRGPLGRHGAIRQKKEEVFEKHGHQFVQKQFYNIMSCALCGEFLRYTGYQCQDCKFLCHKKCYQKVVTKCISKSGSDYDAAQLNHRIPHRFEPITNHGTKWCCHCGYLLPWGKKNVRKCSECGVMCHAQCTHLVPDFCGMSLQMANEILATIELTKLSPKKPAASRQKSQPQLGKQLPPRPSTEAEKKGSLDSGETLRNEESYKSLRPASIAHPELDYVSKLPTTVQNKYQEPVDLPQQHQVAPSSKRRPPLASDLSFDTSYGQHPDQLHQPYQEQLHQKQAYDQQPQGQQQQRFDPRRSQIEQRQSIPPAVAEEYPEEEQQQQQQIVEDVVMEDVKDDFVDFDYHNRNEILANVPDQDMRSPFADQVEPHVPQTALHQPHKQIQQVQQQDLSHHRSHSGGKSGRSKRRKRKVGLDDFQFLAVLGKGNFGKVMLAESRHTDKLCAIKVLKKDFIVENDEAESVKSEKRVFLTANKEMHPFLLNLHCCFQTENRIYFVMEYISGGDLMWHIQKNRFTAKRAKFYACEVLLGLKYFHDNGIVYRDLKLDNILLTTKGHIKIGDYGLCKENMWHKGTTSTFCGTPEFMAPEIVAGKPYDRSVDWWAFGVLLFQMLLCQSPFKGDDEDDIFNAIENDEVKYPINLSRQTVLVLQALLTKDPSQRLGSGPRDADDIMEHPYFHDVNFDDVLHCRIPAPYIPEVQSEHDYSNFDQEFTSETPRLTPVETVLTSEMQEQFRGFSHISDNAQI
ncbi:Protein kinase C-like 1 [Candida viswanathii]|uniref:Protein kinase C-like 1 n=1 Tax=Candida viswanathii TaxID=5486 RepID=A0A367XWX8_9ASCO|nr:Protein kinase C-like 1 [Candida viswanathii]